MIKITKDGRTIRTGRDYTKFRELLWECQGGYCGECRVYTWIGFDIESNFSFHVDHIRGRGMGGSKRDDTLESCRGLCGKCHRIKHNQQ